MSFMLGLRVFCGMNTAFIYALSKGDVHTGTALIIGEHLSTDKVGRRHTLSCESNRRRAWEIAVGGTSIGFFAIDNIGRKESITFSYYTLLHSQAYPHLRDLWVPASSVSI
jgi:hypothetical protein